MKLLFIILAAIQVEDVHDSYCITVSSGILTVG